MRTKLMRDGNKRHGPAWLVCGFALLLLMLAVPVMAGKPCNSDPSHPSCKDDGGGGPSTHDLPTIVVFLDLSGDAVTSDAVPGEAAPYVDGQDKVDSFIGRSNGQFSLTTSNKATSGRMLCLDDQGQIDQSVIDLCGDFRGCRVAKMLSERPEVGGVDLRYLTGEVWTPLWLNLFVDRQNFWHVEYDAVRVDPVVFGADGNPTAWIIDTDFPGSSAANVERIVDNQYVSPIDCGSYLFPFHLEVWLQ